MARVYMTCFHNMCTIEVIQLTLYGCSRVSVVNKLLNAHLLSLKLYFECNINEKKRALMQKENRTHMQLK